MSRWRCPCTLFHSWKQKIGISKRITWKLFSCPSRIIFPRSIIISAAVLAISSFRLNQLFLFLSQKLNVPSHTNKINPFGCLPLKILILLLTHSRPALVVLSHSCLWSTHTISCSRGVAACCLKYLPLLSLRNTEQACFLGCLLVRGFLFANISQDYFDSWFIDLTEYIIAKKSI